MKDEYTLPISLQLSLVLSSENKLVFSTYFPGIILSNIRHGTCFHSGGDTSWLLAPVIQVNSTTAESFHKRESCSWRDRGSFGVPIVGDQGMTVWKPGSVEMWKSKAGTVVGKLNLEHGYQECIYTHRLWSGTWRTSLLRKGFGGACLGHLDDLNGGDAFAGYTVSGAQLVQSSLCHTGPLLSIIQLMYCFPVASKSLVGLLLLQQRHSGKRDVNLACSG